MSEKNKFDLFKLATVLSKIEGTFPRNFSGVAFIWLEEVQAVDGSEKHTGQGLVLDQARSFKMNQGPSSLELAFVNKRYIACP